MKVLHVINLQGVGGTERVFIKYLKNSSFDNEILCTSNSVNKNIKHDLLKFNIRFANFIGGSKIKSLGFMRKYLLSRKIEKSKADVTIIWDLVPRLAFKPRNTTLVYYDHGSSWHYERNQRTKEFFDMLDYIIAASNASKRMMELRLSPQCRIKTVVNKLPMRVSDLAKTIKNKDVVILGTASRIVGTKAIGISVLTLNELLKNGINAKLVIAGDGEQKEQLETLVINLGIKDSVVFSGYQADVDKFYSNIDIYLSTPVTEPFGLSCIEALSHGIPVIFPVIDGQPEAIKDKYCGVGIIPNMSTDTYYKTTGLNVNFPYEIYDPIKDRLSSPKLIDPIECATAIQYIINNYNQLSKNSLEWSKETMNYDLFIKEFESILQQ
ncbi:MULTISPECIES: glycosyltransferase [Proteus]|uniref:glycosyltransferase n=1 Tax=Proteus TaxID=583 RepID=UPI001378CE1C|nr:MULTISPECIES: glycosyltransferase [Proteus]NBL91302.1 glycosyltransferase [Proteus sp. G2673]HEJ9512759.1 glycosyltransferase [Proteus mirabilis]